MKTKEFFIAIFFIIASLVIYGLFPTKNVFQQIIVMATFFVLIPILFNKFILKKQLSDIGIKVGDWKQGAIWCFICFFVAGLLFFVAVYFFDLLRHYSVPTTITNDYKNFLFYEFILILPVVFIYDFFFRGFIIFTLGNRIYYWAVAVQVLLFLILILATNSLVWGLTPYLIGAPLAGLIAYKSRSIFYSIGFQFIIMIIFDANIVRLIK